jgi:hypothetical protein
MLEKEKSKPYFSAFSPDVIPYQREVVNFLDNWDYSSGTPEILLSGSYGSAKSILMAHLVVRHCLEWTGAKACLARKAMPDLKDTIFKEILEHLAEDFIEGIHYWVNNTSAKITFFNGSEILSRSWSDKKYKKGRSLKLSMLVIEEISENSLEDMEAFKTLKARLRRLPHVSENILIAATNPDSPTHWVYRYFIEEQKPTRKVFYSVTTDNPYLDPIYIQQLQQDLSPQEADRYLRGKWVDIDHENIYAAYKKDRNFKSQSYEINKQLPIHMCFDFNIGTGKPMSSCVFQYFNQTFHVFDEAVVHGARTLDIMEEWFERGLFYPGVEIIIHGDAAGNHRDTRSTQSDYDQIKKYLAQIPGLRFKIEVPLANPPIRQRHNRINSHCINELGQVRLYLYEKCKVLDEGLRLTAFKKGANMVEDDSFYAQHITTALGYGVTYVTNKSKTTVTSQKVR